MFTILESIAVVEINKDAKKFNNKQKKIKKQSYQEPVDELDIYGEFGSETSSVVRKRDANSLDEESKSYDEMKRLESAVFYDRFEFDRDLEEELFQDASEEFIYDTQQVITKKSFIQDVYEERLTLPHFRPPKLKISVWTILKDLIGKDLSRISMPVYFNEPLSMC